MIKFHEQISKSFFGSNAKITDILIIGSVIGVISGLGPLYEAQPVLFFVPFAWFLYVLTKTYTFVKSPRKNDWAFILGIAYSFRRKLVLDFITKKTVELSLICAIAALVFFGMRSICYHDIAVKETISSFEIMSGEIVCSLVSVWLLIKAKIIRPSKKDPPSRSLFSFSQKNLFSFFSAAMSSKFSRFSIPFLSNEQKIILRRQFLYILRTSPLSTAAFMLIAVVFYVTVIIFTPSSQTLFLCFLGCIPPTIVLLEMTTAMSNSAEKAASCPYYSFKPHNVFFVNILLCILVFAFFPLALLVKTVLLGHLFAALPLLRVGAAFASGFTVCLSFALRWNKSDWDGSSSALFGLACFCCILGISIPYFGILFPLAASLLIFVLK